MGKKHEDGPKAPPSDHSCLKGKRFDDKVPQQFAFTADRRPLGISRKFLRISGSRDQLLQRRRTDIQNLLVSADQSILFFGPDLTAGLRPGADCRRIFGRDVAGASVAGLLAQDGSMTEEALATIFARAFAAGGNGGQQILRQLPAVFRIGDKSVRVESRITPDEGRPSQIALLLTDITEILLAAERIHYLSYFDKLTSLYNRAYIEMMLPELEKKENLPLSIIMLDMNGLKLTNDVFGHEQGDRLLVALADVLMQSCRNGDIIGRWGGDEFLVLLPKTPGGACAEVCTAIRRAMAASAHNPIPLSAAIGMATKGSGRANLAELFLVAENRMYNSKLVESQEVRRSVIAAMETMLRKHCFENAGHSERVGRLAAGFAAFLGVGQNELELSLLSKLATLHDIGKVAIPRQILGKPGPLTAREWEIVMSHSDIGYRLAQSIGEPVLAEFILALHERWDGKGYPFGLEGDRVPVLVRLFSLVDVYDVIVNDRPYKRAMDKRTALREIAAGAGSKFDPVLAGRFVEYLNVLPE